MNALLRFLGINTPVWPEAAEYYATTDHVQERLIATLYEGQQSIVGKLRTTFEQRALIFPTDCVQYWTEEIFINYLTESNKDIEAIISSAGPLLYKTAIHHGAYPFPPTAEAKLSFTFLLIFIGMFSRLQDGKFVTVDELGPRSSYTITKPRDRGRLLFQSIAQQRAAFNPETRDKKDDEDLLDVLESVHGGLYGTHNPGWTRESLGPVAQQLPSSRSADVDGVITEPDLRVLAKLCIALDLRNAGVELPAGPPRAPFIENMVQPLVALFPVHKKAGIKGVKSRAFCKVLNSSAPCFFAILRELIESTFGLWPLSYPLFGHIRLPMPQNRLAITSKFKDINSQITIIHYITQTSLSNLYLSTSGPRLISNGSFSSLLPTPLLLLFSLTPATSPSHPGTQIIIGALLFPVYHNDEVVRPENRYSQISLFELAPGPKLLSREQGTLEVTSDMAGVKVCLLGDNGMKVICEQDQSVLVEYRDNGSESVLRLESWELWGS